MNRQPEHGWGPYRWALGFLVWLGFAMIAVAGGIFRVVWLEPRWGEFSANLGETLALAGLLAGLIWLATPWLVPGLRHRDLKMLGAYWASLTIGFEFLFGHFVDKAPWSVLLANYDLSAGRLWILIPLTMGFGPLLVGRLRSARGSHHERTESMEGSTNPVAGLR